MSVPDRYVGERSVGVEDARSSLGRLMDEVAETGGVIALTKRGRAQAMLISREEYWKFKLAANKESRERLAEYLAVVSDAVERAGLDISIVDEAVAEVRRSR